MRVCTRLLFTVVILLIISQTVTGQKLLKPGTSVADTSRISLAVTAGYVTPKSKESLTEFWKGGPGFAVTLLIRKTPALSFGVGADVSVFWFRWSGFARAYPTVEVRRTNMAWVNLFLFSRYAFITGGRVKPYGGLALGASRLSGAEYKEVIDSVRVTYYEIPARTRLALTLASGVEIPVSQSVSFLAEAILRYVHNDPNLGVGLGVGGGVKVKL